MQSVNCCQQNPRACHWDVLSWTCPSQQCQKSQSMGSTAKAKAAAFLGCQQRPEAIPRPWRKGEISARRPPHPHSAEVSLFEATSHHQHMEGLQGFAFWVTGRQIWSAPTQLKFLSNTETFPWTKITSAALASQPHWAGLNCHWADHYLCLFNEQRSKELRWHSLEYRHASYISFTLDKIQ